MFCFQNFRNPTQKVMVCVCDGWALIQFKAKQLLLQTLFHKKNNKKIKIKRSRSRLYSF